MFRQEAINNKKMKWYGRAIILPGVPFWVISLLCVFFIIVVFSFVIFGSYTRRINVSGEITSYPHAANFFSTVQGVVVKKFVVEGQILKIGDPIYQINVSKSTLNGVVSENQKHDIKNQIERIEMIISKLESSKLSTVNMLEKQKKQYIVALERSANILQQAENGLRIMKDNMNNYKIYREKGLINKDQLTNQIALYYQQQNSLLNLASQHEQNALQITAIENEIHTKAAEFDNYIYQMELQRYELQKEILNTEASDTIIIRAFSAGRVNSLSVTEGQMVNVGDSLLQIVPDEIERYNLVLWVPNEAIPYIAIGDKVNLRYEAFPVEKFGQFAGVVSLISKVPASSQEMSIYKGAPKDLLAANIPYYKVIVIPEKQTIYYNGKNLSLESGMKTESTLFLEKRNIYQWMLTPFYNMKLSVTEAVDE